MKLVHDEGTAMATTTDEFGDFYDQRRAAADLKRYREKGPPPWTKTVVESLKAAGVQGATLLDIGSGVGVIVHELVAAGAVSATCVDASAAYLATAKAEGERRGHGVRVTYRHGDFVELAEEIAPADIVTLDRVINVYPDWERLIELSAARARRLCALVYPWDRRVVRLVIVGINLTSRLRGKAVRAAVRPVDAIERALGENGFTLHVAKSVGPAWQVAVYRRPDSTARSASSVTGRADDSRTN
jgi:SAM-dependent methyltransferase